MTNDKFIEKCIEKFIKHITEQLKDAEEFTVVSEEAPNRIHFKYRDKKNKRVDSGYIQFNIFM